MRPRPSLVAAGILLLALIHAYWGFRMLGFGRPLFAGSQLVSAGGLILAAVSVSSRRTFSTGFAIAAIATSFRFLGQLDSPGPFLAPTGLLVLALAIVAYAAHALDNGHPAAWPAGALRGGFVLLGVGYMTFAVLGRLSSASPIESADLLIRAATAVTLAVVIDAPPLRVRERKAFPDGPPMRTS